MKALSDLLLFSGVGLGGLILVQVLREIWRALTQKQKGKGKSK